MRIKSLLLTIALCGAVGVSVAQEKAAVDTTEMGVHPYKETHNLTWNTTGFSLIFHGGVNSFRGDYPTDRFVNFGYPSAGIALEYNFTPCWGLGFGYNFAMPIVKTKKDEPAFTDVDGVSTLSVAKGDVMHKGMMHSGQAYVTFNLINAWFPRAWSDIFGLNLFAGFGVSFYKNSVSFHDTGDINPATGKETDPRKYVKDGDDAHAHDKFENVGYVPLGASAEFNVSRDIAIGARFQYNMFLNDYVDNRYNSKANKSNDGMYDAEILLRWKIAAKKKNHWKNVASTEVLEEKYYTSHPHRRPGRKHAVDTLVVYHQDTLVIIHRDTVFMGGLMETPVQEKPMEVQPTNTGRCDLELYPGWESKADAVVVEGQSLSQLARKYYNNTFCWVYLWIANRSIAPDPNIIMPKCVLKVPKLNDCQRSITKQEAKDMCARYRAE
jgi:hypothetical protein